MTMVERIFEEVEKLQEESVLFLKDMIRIRTENPPGLNYDRFVQFATDFLDALGYKIDVVQVPTERLPELAKLGEGPRASIVARIGNGHPSIAFNGHYDVVPAGDGWTVDAYAGVERNGRIYGRGACDMKAGITAQIFAVEALRRAGIQIEEKGTIRQFLVPDEETVGNVNAGTYYVVQQGHLAPNNTDFVIFTEPLGLENIGYGHRGAIWGTVKVKGLKAHGGFPQLGIDATLKTCRLIDRLYATLHAEFASKWSSYKIIPDAARQPSFVVGTLRCGTWANTVSDCCEFWFVRRIIPEESVTQARADIVEILESVKLEDPSFVYEYSQYYSTDSKIGSREDELARSLQRSVKQVRKDEPLFVLSPGTFDIRFTLDAGIPSLNYGPGKIELAHTSDEYLEKTELSDTTKVLALCTARLLHVID